MKFVILFFGALTLATICYVSAEPQANPEPNRKPINKVLVLKIPDVWYALDKAIMQKPAAERELWWEECMYHVMRNDVLEIEIDPISETARVVKPWYRDGFSDYKKNRKKANQPQLKDLLK